MSRRGPAQQSQTSQVSPEFYDTVAVLPDTRVSREYLTRVVVDVESQSRTEEAGRGDPTQRDERSGRERSRGSCLEFPGLIFLNTTQVDLRFVFTIQCLVQGLVRGAGLEFLTAETFRCHSSLKTKAEKEGETVFDRVSFIA